MPHARRRPTRWSDLFIAGQVCVAGLLSAGFAWRSITHGTLTPDFEFWWRATRLLRAGIDPYAMRPGMAAWPLLDRLFYPGTALVLTWPFAGLPLLPAYVLWAAVSGVVLAWALLRTGRAVLPVLLSPPFLFALRFGQWSPWLTAACLVPALGAVLGAKPTLGAALFGARPTRVAFASGVIVLLVSLLWLPTWPLGWLANLHFVRGHPPPIASPAGAMLAVAVIRWRQPEARLLLLYACVPQLLYWADQLPVLLVARRRVESLVLLLASVLGCIAWFGSFEVSAAAFAVTRAEPYVMASIYLPALLIVLARPNAGAVPEWLDAALLRVRAPAWLRGGSSTADGEPRWPRAR